MKILWCEEHEASAVEDLTHCWKRQWLLDVGGHAEPCRMVRMTLIPGGDDV